MPHRNAPLASTGRLRLARCVVDDGWPLRRAAERFQVPVTCAQRWSGRYRTHGPAGMDDRPSRPPPGAPAPGSRDEIGFATKPQLGVAMLERAHAAGMLSGG